jgi:hypothetical protein
LTRSIDAPILGTPRSLDKEPRVRSFSVRHSLSWHRVGGALSMLAAVLAVSACGPSPAGRITAPNAQAKAAESMQSEAVISTGYSGGTDVVTVAYNDETDSAGTIVYTETGRTILKGASLMGWSYSTDRGVSWTYGGKVSPPQGWAVLWGDPALATSRAHYYNVFLANLAIPTAKMPANGIQGYVYYGSGSYIGGACIAKSNDGGRSFANWQCVSNTTKTSEADSEKGHFYDGATIVSSGKGEIFAAFNDVFGGKIDVWRSPDANGTMQMLPNPFPGYDMQTHPRLRAPLFGSDVYVAAQASNGAVYINRWADGAWGQPRQASEPGVVYPEIVLSSTLSVRTGPQFSFDIGAASDGGGDAIRVLVTRRDKESGRLYVQGSFCPLNLGSNCQLAKEWGTTPGNLNTPGDQFNPNVAAWPGFIGLAPVWKGSYLDRSGSPANTLSLKQGNLAYLPNGTRIYVPFTAIGAMTPCPDKRGYWGDYNDLLFIGFPKDSTSAEFLATATDSSLGCPVRWEFFSRHQHVQAARFF